METEGQVVIGVTFEDKVIKLEDVVLLGGIDIVLSNITTRSIIDSLEQLAEGDGLFTIIAFGVIELYKVKMQSSRSVTYIKIKIERDFLTQFFQYLN